jgi:hypothetical protein
LETSITSARAELVLELRDAALVQRLLGLLGGVILGIFREVAVGARLGDRGDDPGPLHLLAVAAARSRGP